jgi:hypothetical protein
LKVHKGTFYGISKCSGAMSWLSATFSGNHKGCNTGERKGAIQIAPSFSIF